MTEKKDYYEVLGVERDADQKSIREAFRKLALHHHPDRDKSPGAEERFRQIAEAYAVLSDPKKRTEYDNRGFAGISGFSSEDLFGGIDFGDLFGGGVFDRFFRRSAGPAPGENLEAQLAVPLEKIARGGEEEVRIERAETCPVCRGSGAEKASACNACRGTGQVRKSRQEGRGNVVIQEISTCPACRGKGMIVEEYCTNCGGRGEIGREETLKVVIPPGVEEGMALRVHGKGMPGPEGGPHGDLFVVVRSLPDPRFERDGADLWHAESISVLDAVLGAQITVGTLDGEARVAVPPGSQPDSVLRLKGKGLPKSGSRGTGDLYVKLKVRLPERLSWEERALYEKLRSMPHER